MYEGWIDADGTVASVDERPTRNGTVSSVVFTYKVNGEWLGGTFTTYEQYRQGDMIPLRYDPGQPRTQ